jgi:hypothetical protein
MPGSRDAGSPAAGSNRTGRPLRQPGVAELMAASLVEAFRDGTRGAAYGEPCSAAPGGSHRPASACREFICGTAGSNGRYRCRRRKRWLPSLPSCTARFCSDDGHTSLIGSHVDEIVSSLTARM